MKLVEDKLTNSSSIWQCEEALTILRQQSKDIKAFYVASLFLFGSVVRNQATATSDIDLLVEFTKPVGMLTMAKLQVYLEKLMGCAIDLGIIDSLRPDIKDVVMAEAKRVF
jgi:predicted nucleotidyltransferase